MDKHWYIDEFYRGVYYNTHGPWDEGEAQDHLEMMEAQGEPGVEYQLIHKD